MIRPAVIDTNVVVAGLITRTPSSPTRFILDSMLRARFAFVLSPDLLQEYMRVLARPRISAIHRLAPRQLDVILTELVASAIIRHPPHAPTRSEEHIRRLVKTRPIPLLVTGDAVLVETVTPSVRPAEFARDLESIP